MDVSVERRALEICSQAIGLSRQERTVFVDGQCNGDESLKQLVAQLLDNMTVADNALPTGGAAAFDELDLTGMTLGPYHLEKVLGVGGMGTVYLAQRTLQGGRASYALKTLNRASPSRGELERFNTEQRTLARLNHPYIASFVDFGSSDDGLPYYVMEYVDGQTITTHADDNNLSVRQRIGLWLKVCEAVRESHNHLVVHRDLKPSNVIVTGADVPKLLDFGVAHLLEAEQGAISLTQAYGAQYTLAYASPERILQGQSGTHEDQYALGVLLYELLTGVLPFERSQQTLEELRQQLLDTHAAPMSTRLGQLPEREQLEIAQQRGTHLRRLRAELTSDIDAIVHKTTHPDPARRYASVDALMMDVERFLADQPVQAKPDTFGYKVHKFIQRNTVPVAATALSVLVLVSALAVSINQTRQTLQHLSRAEAMSSFLSDIIAAPSTRWNSDLRAGPDAGMSDILLLAAERLRTLQDIAPETRAELHLALGIALDSWGLVAESAEQALRAVDIVRVELAPDHPMQERARTEAAIALDMSRIPANIETSSMLLREALAWIDEYAPGDRLRRAGTLSEFGYNSQVRGDMRQAISYYTEAMQLWFDAGGDPRSPRIALGYALVGVCHMALGEYDAAKSAFQSSKAIYDTDKGTPGPEWSQAYYNLLLLAMLRGTPEETLQVADDIMRIIQVNALEYPSLRSGLNMVAYAYTLVGEQAKADAILDELELAPRGDSPAVDLAATSIVRAAWWLAEADTAMAQEQLLYARGTEEQFAHQEKFLLALTEAELWLAQGDLESARAGYGKTLSLQPQMLRNLSLIGGRLQSFTSVVEAAPH